jgi:hypothetical protein
LRAHLVVFLLIAGLVLGMPLGAFAQEEPEEQSPEATERKAEGDESVGTKAENAALAVTSVIVSAAQAPLRAGTCGATVIVGGLAYLLTVFDSEARQGPADAIKRVCEGPYVSTPEDLRGNSAPSR